MSKMIGCDPEWVIQSKKDGRYHAADRVIGDYFNTCMTDDEYDDDGFDYISSMIGCDGASFTGEFRPNPSETIGGMIKNVRNCILTFDEALGDDYDLRAGHFAGNAPIGGHVHLDWGLLGAQQERTSIRNMDMVYRVLTLKLDDAAQRRERRRVGYGRLGDYRGADWGIEYRTPGSWILNPAIATVVTSYLKIAAGAETLINRPARIRHNDFLINIDSFTDIPADCQDGVLLMPQVLKKKWNWNVGIVEAWK